MDASSSHYVGQEVDEGLFVGGIPKESFLGHRQRHDTVAPTSAACSTSMEFIRRRRRESGGSVIVVADVIHDLAPASIMAFSVLRRAVNVNALRAKNLLSKTNDTANNNCYVYLNFL